MRMQSSRPVQHVPEAAHCAAAVTPAIERLALELAEFDLEVNQSKLQLYSATAGVTTPDGNQVTEPLEVAKALLHTREHIWFRGPGTTDHPGAAIL